jgi:Pyruvate/2-oxoacid:ferredoxin oxidoreductase gamma subunit
VEEELARICPRLLMVDPQELGRRIEKAVFFNVALLGLVSSRLDIPESAWIRAITAKVPESYREQNISAFKQGMLFYQSGLKEATR